MDLGTGIAIGTITIGATTVVVTWFKGKASSNGNGNGKPCPLHSGIEATLVFLKDGQKRIEEKLDRVLGGE